MDNEKWEVFFMPRNRRCKHDEKTKRLAVDLFEKGYGERSAASALAVPRETVRQWLYIFRASGLEGLLAMGSKRTKYAYEQKVAAASAVVDDGMAKADAMARFGIASLAPLERWCRLYREGGAEALRPKPKGRPRGAVAKPKAPMTREEELEARVRKLEAENAYLKKLEALRAEETLRTGSRPRW